MALTPLDDLQIKISVETEGAIKSIKKLADSIKTLSTTKIDTSNVKKLVTEISQLDKTSAGLHNLAKDLSAIASAMKTFTVPKGLATDMNNLIRNFGSAEDALYKTGSNRGVSGASRTIDSLVENLTRLNEVGNSLDGLSNIADRLGDIADQGSRLTGISRDITNVRRAVESASQSGQNMSGLAVRMEQIMDSAASAEDSLYNFGNATPSVEGLGNAVNDASRCVDDVCQSCESAADALDRAGNEAEKTGKRFDRAAKGGISNFFASIKRIAMYRAIRSALKFLSAAIKEGFEMFVTWDKEQNNYMAGTALNVDKLTEKWTILKGQIGALGGALFNGLAPIITWVVEQITKLVDLLQMVIRSLQGEYSYYRLIYKSAKATTGQAKELKRILFGFDELNVLNSPSGSGGTSGGGSWIYNEIPIENKFLNSIADASNKLRDFFGISKDGQKTIGSLVGVLGLLLGAKAIGGLISAIPRLISLFKGKNQALADQSRATEVETGKVLGLAGAFGVGLAAAKKLKDYFDTNPMNAKVGMAVDYSQMSTIPTVITAFEVFLKANPLTVVLTAPFKALASAFESFRNNIQTFFNNNPISIATQAAGGAVTGKGYKTGSLAKNFADPLAASYAADARNISQTVSQAMSYAFEEYEATGWRSEWLGTDTAKTVAALGVGTLGTAIAAVAGVGAALAEFFSSLGLQSILGFANGGTPDVGTLFYAGEAGAEVVANMGHSTGVMNVDQMEAAVANGNVEVINAIYAMANMVVGAVNNKNFDVYMDAQKVGKSVSQYQLNYARSMGV